MFVPPYSYLDCHFSFILPKESCVEFNSLLRIFFLLAFYLFRLEVGSISYSLDVISTHRGLKVQV